MSPAKTGPIPDPESVTLSSAGVLDQFAVLATRMREENFSFSLWYRDGWKGQFSRSDLSAELTVSGRYPIEVIYMLLRDWDGQ